MSLASMLNPVDDGQDDQGRDIKRRRVDSVPARSLHHATHDLPSARSAWSPTAFEQPQHLSSFSYSPARELLLPSSGRADEALRIYAEPPLGANLNRGIAEAVMRKEGVAEGLDSLLAWWVRLAVFRAQLIRIQPAGYLVYARPR